MALKRELIKVLDDENQPLPKRIKTANNAFISSELPLQHKEAILIHWLLKHFDGKDETISNFFLEWLKSPQFNEITRNDISQNEIKDIIEIIIEKNSLVQDPQVLQQILDGFLVVANNNTIQQYFRFNVDMYCKFISSILDTINDCNILKTFLNSNIFLKNIITENLFVKHFYESIMPSLINCALKFDDTDIFQQISKIMQKCLFYSNRKSFGLYIGQYFEDNKIEKQPVPKNVFKNLLEAYKLDTTVVKMHFKLFFHAFCSVYDTDFELVYKSFIILIHILGFDLNQKLIFHKVSKLQVDESEISLSKSQEIIVELLEVLSEMRINLKCSVKEIPFNEFLINLLVEFLRFNLPGAISYKIFLKAMSINPLITESLMEEIIVYAMLADNKNCQTEYEEFILSIIDVYSKLHRVESLISKMIEALNNGFKGKTEQIHELYAFRGQIDLEINNNVNLHVDCILTENILKCFNKCICGLASWQVINIFKTLLFHLNKILSEIDGTENDDLKYCTFMNILSKFLSNFLSSIRVAEHTVTENVVKKCIKCLDDLQNSLKIFGSSLVKREHNHLLMWSFLNIAFHWAEVRLTLKYYCGSNFADTLNGLPINDYTSANITFLHPYLTVKEWNLISERITNFGEHPCKMLLYKLYIQKIRALRIFQNNFNEDITTNILRNVTAHLENDWQDILEDKFVVKHLLPKMTTSAKKTLVENMLNDIENFGKFEKYQHILQSPQILDVVNYIVLTKINKTIAKQKRKHDDSFSNSLLSSKVLSTFSEEIFIEKGDCHKLLEQARNLLAESTLESKIDWKINEQKVCGFLNILKKFPIIFSSETNQKISLLYCFGLHKDLSNEFSKGNYKNLRLDMENYIFGILQYNKFQLGDVFNINVLCLDVIDNFLLWQEIFTIITENVLKNEQFVQYYHLFVAQVTEKLSHPAYMHSSIVIINTINKIKKLKMPKQVKDVADEYKCQICDKMLGLIKENTPEDHLLAGFAYALKHYLSQNDSKKLATIFEHIKTYLEFALNSITQNANVGCLPLFITILQNKSKIKNLDEDVILKIWNACKENFIVYDRFEEYSQLVVLIVTHIHEEFSEVLDTLLSISQTCIDTRNFELFGKHLKTWEAIMSSNMNPNKIKLLQEASENLLQKMVLLLQQSQYDKKLYESIMNLQKVLVQANHMHLTPGLLDLLLLTLTNLMEEEEQDFENIINQSISMLSVLLKYRKPLIMDRLPPYLQVYRKILKAICKKGNSDLNLEESGIREVVGCAHELEKLTKSLVVFQKDMGRIAMYLIADILDQYEQVTLYPNVKLHLNNCMYSLIAICDQHAVTYLLRVLSSASTEIFKLMYDNYKKYYRFTGKI